MAKNRGCWLLGPGREGVVGGQGQMEGRKG